jgi:hypothetical protein
MTKVIRTWQANKEAVEKVTPLIDKLEKRIVELEKEVKSLKAEQKVVGPSKPVALSVVLDPAKEIKP